MDNINWSRTRDILICIIGVGIILWASFNILGVFVDAILILLLSMAVAFLISPGVDLLEKRGVPRILGAFIFYLIILGVIGAFGYGVVVTLIQQAVTFSDTITHFVKVLPDTFQNVIATLGRQGVNVNAVINQIQGQVAGFAQTVTFNSLNFLVILTNAFLNILLVIVLSFYLTLDGKHIRDSIIGIVPRRSLPNVLLFEDALNRVVGNYIRGQLTLALIVGIATGLACVIAGLGNFALICALLAFLFETIPMIGPALASITPILLSLLVPGLFPRATIILVVAFVIIQIVESNILGPRIVGHAVGLHPVAAILALLVGAKLFGIFGALLATPIVAASWVVIASIYRSARGETADQMLAKKRAPWTLPRPYGGRRRKAPVNGSIKGGAHVDEVSDVGQADPDFPVSEPEPSSEVRE